MAGSTVAAQRKAALLGISVEEYKAEKLRAYKSNAGRQGHARKATAAVRTTESYVAAPRPAAPAISIVDDPLAAAVAAAKEAEPESPLAKQMATLVELSLKRALEIMSIELDPDMPGLKDIMARQSAVMAQVFSADRAAGNGTFRQRNDDKLGLLLADIRKEKGLSTPAPAGPRAPAFLAARQAAG